MNKEKREEKIGEEDHRGTEAQRKGEERELPEGWCFVIFEKIVENQEIGMVRSKLEQSSCGEIFYFKMNNITSSGELLLNDLVKIDATKSEIERYKLKNGDFLFNTRNSPELVGKSAIFLDENKRTILYNNNIMRIRFPGWINGKYIHRYFNSPFMKSLIYKSCNATTSVAAVYGKQLDSFLIPLAPLAEQVRIAERLDRLLGKLKMARTHLEAVPDIIKRFRKSVLAQAVSGKLTEEWREEQEIGFISRRTTVKDLITDIRYGTAKKCGLDSSLTPVLRIPNIVNGKIDHVDLKYARFENGEYEKLSLQYDDLLIIRSNGSNELVGKVALVDMQDVGLVFAGYLIRIRPNTSLVLSRFLLLSFASPSLREKIEKMSKSSSGVNNINSNEIGSLQINIYPLLEQAEIVRRVDELFAYADALEKRVGDARRMADRLEPAILAKAFRGELSEQVPEEAIEWAKTLAALEADAEGMVKVPKARAKKMVTDEAAETAGEYVVKKRGRPRKDSPAR